MAHKRDCGAALCADPPSDAAPLAGRAVLGPAVAARVRVLRLLGRLLGRADLREELLRDGLLDQAQQFVLVVRVAQDAQGDRAARALCVAARVLLAKRL